VMRKEGRFREDLYYRLSVFPLRLPPLRERGDDVVLLAEHFAQKFARRLGREIAPLGPADQARLLAYEWPGNVRELANVIERAVITARQGRLDLERALPESDRGAPVAVAEDSNEPRIRTVGEMEALERENLRRALAQSDWKVSGTGGAAERLGMRPTTLTSRMKALGLRRPD